MVALVAAATCIIQDSKCTQDKMQAIQQQLAVNMIMVALVAAATCMTHDSKCTQDKMQAI
jgi:Pyruvate/2-oxoacid:ferredoxin oxidoreductase gamma subunit